MIEQHMHDPEDPETEPARPSSLDWPYSDAFDDPRTLFETLPDGYYETDLHGKLTFVNDSLAQILGYSRDQLTSHWLRDVRRHMLRGPMRELAEAGRRICHTQVASQLDNVAVKRRDGTTRYLQISIALITDLDNRPIGYRGVVRDVTPQHQVEAALNQQVALMAVLRQVDAELNQTLDAELVLKVALNAALVLSHADAGYIALFDGDQLRVARASGPYQQRPVSCEGGIVGRVLRRRCPELVQDAQRDADPRSSLPDTQAQMTLPLAQHDRLIGVLNLETMDADRFTAETFDFVNLLTTRIAAAVANANLYQIAQQRLKELRGLYEQVSALEQLKTEMIRVATHDIRSPLGLIKGYIEILRLELTDMLQEAQVGYVDAIEQSIKRIEQLTTDVLSLERIEMKRGQPTERINLIHVIEHAVSDHRHASRQKAQTLYTELPDDTLTILGDSIDLVEAVGNLLNNAIKYTPEGGRVEVRLRQVHNRALLEVEDTGYGIPADKQAKVFEAFYRVKTDETRRIMGTGLGLYLVKRIVERHGGRVNFKSVIGQGSRFWIELPLVHAEALPQT
ncbi:MAG: PAS domain S-box protein [Chloroflexi bacterium]|nr:PAS domain S-box protein [Chloroflexota bacterium]